MSEVRTIVPGFVGAGAAFIVGDRRGDAFSPVGGVQAEFEVASAGCAAKGLEAFSPSFIQLPPKVLS
jgi:hypothetical protein